MGFKVTFISPGTAPKREQLMDAYNSEVQGTTKRCAEKFEVSTATLYGILREFNVREIGKYRAAGVRGPASSIFNFIDVQGAMDTKRRSKDNPLLKELDSKVHATSVDIAKMLAEAGLNPDPKIFVAAFDIKETNLYRKEGEIGPPFKLYPLGEVQKAVDTLSNLSQGT